MLRSFLFLLRCFWITDENLKSLGDPDSNVRTYLKQLHCLRAADTVKYLDDYFLAEFCVIVCIFASFQRLDKSMSQLGSFGAPTFSVYRTLVT